MEQVIQKLERIIGKLHTFKVGGKKFSFTETGDVCLAVERLEKTCEQRQMRHKEE